MCGAMKKAGPVPDFACMGPGESGIWPANATKFNSWSREETPTKVKIFRPYFHYMSWEYHTFGNLHHTNWEYEDLVSMIVIKDPLERFLSAGKCGKFHTKKKNRPKNKPSTNLAGDPKPETMALYWEYANDNCSDNYALRVLAADAHCVQGARTSRACLEGAKSLLRRFTFILDASCLGESLGVVGEALHLDLAPEDVGQKRHHPNEDVRGRFHNDTLYEFLRDRFRRDIELYEWAQARSVVQCAAKDAAEGKRKMGKRAKKGNKRKNKRKHM